MNNPALYRVISHLDKPYRFLSLTMDELGIALIGLMLLASSNHKIWVGCFVAFIFSVLKYLKCGKGPRFILVQVYWHLPSFVSKAVVAKLPASYLRVWRA